MQVECIRKLAVWLWLRNGHFLVGFCLFFQGYGLFLSGDCFSDMVMMKVAEIDGFVHKRIHLGTIDFLAVESLR